MAARQARDLADDEEAIAWIHACRGISPAHVVDGDGAPPDAGGGDRRDPAPDRPAREGHHRSCPRSSRRCQARHDLGGRRLPLDGIVSRSQPRSVGTREVVMFAERHAARHALRVPAKLLSAVKRVRGRAEPYLPRDQTPP